MASGTGSAFGGKLLRYWSVSWASLALTQTVGLVSALVVVRYLGPGEFDRLALLIFLAGLVNFVVGLCCQPGTISRVFGMSDEDDEEEEADTPPGEAIERILGTGLALVVLVGASAVAISLLLAESISAVLLRSTADQAIVPVAVAAGGLGAVYRLASTCVWMERRPRTFLLLSAAHAVLIVAGVLAFVVSGAGVSGAITGTAIGSGASALLAIAALWRSFRPAFVPREAVNIVRRAPRRVPIVGSMWIIEYASIFMLSRFVASAELGIFQLANRFAMVVGLGGISVRLALCPLGRSTFFAAVQEHYGPPRARGYLFSYYLLAAIGLTLAAALLAPVFVALAPSSYEAAAALIPVLALAQLVPTSFKFLNSSVRFRRKRPVFVRAMVIAAVSFVGFALILIPLLGVVGAPIAILLAFAAPTAYFAIRSQRGPEPLELPLGRVALCALAAALLAVAFHRVALPGLAMQVAAALALFAAWTGIVILSGAVPREQRPGLARALASVVRTRGSGLEDELTLAYVDHSERLALRMAVVERRSLEEIAPVLDTNAAGAGERLVRALRRASVGPAGEAPQPSELDREIGRCLFSRAGPAVRQAQARRILRSGQVEARELHGLETAVATLAKASSDVWEGDRPAVAGDGRAALSMAGPPGTAGQG